MWRSLMEFSYFDLVVAVVVLLLGLKGIINGFFKELFGLIGIIGGIFIASRVGESVGEYLNALIFNFSSPAAVSFAGFLITLAVFWLLMIALGFFFKKLSNVSGLGPVDRIFGFIFGAGKFFLIGAIIAHAVYSIKAVHAAIDSKLETSVLFPILVETGGFIMKIDPTEMTQEVNATLQEGTQALEEKTQELVKESAQQQIQEIKNKIEEEK